MRKKSRQLQYRSQACIAIAQVFLGVAAATFFTPPLNLDKYFITILNVIITLVFLIIGSKYSQ